MKLLKENYKIISALLILFVLVYFLLPVGSVPRPEYKTLDIKNTGNITVISEDGYETTMNENILPELEKIKQTGYFKNKRGYTNYYEQFLVENPIGTIVISHGFTESISKFYEMIYYFTNADYNVFGLDHSGHGNSFREVEDLSLVHIDNYQDYLDDFADFIDIIVKEKSTSDKYYLYSHSMGGAIGALYLQEYPDFFKAAVLSTPMMDINTGKVPKRLSKLIASVYSKIGKSKDYIYGHGPYEHTIEDKSGTTISQERNDFYYSMRKNNEYLQCNGGSFGWLNASFQAIDRITAKENAQKIKTPAILFQAEKDELVDPDGQNKFVHNSDNVSLILVEDSSHSIYHSTNEILPAYLNEIFSFYQENAA